jgi:hypothetical protein
LRAITGPTGEGERVQMLSHGHLVSTGTAAGKFYIFKKKVWVAE